jgi:hypothetical protein
MLKIRKAKSGMKNSAGTNDVRTFINGILAAMCPRFVIVTKMKRTNKRRAISPEQSEGVIIYRTSE